MNDFDTAWARIRGCAGQEFKTVRGLPFTYALSGEFVQPSRTEVELPKEQFRRVHELMPISGPGEIRDLVIGPSYIYAILTDRRIRT